MTQVTFSSLKLKNTVETKNFDFFGKQIEVDQFASIEDKLDIIAVTMQKANQNGIYNPILLDVFFHLNLVYIYTNITFTDKQREDELKIFDLLEQNGFFELFLPLIKEDYEELRNYLNEMTNYALTYGNSAASVARNLIYNLPENAEAAKMIIDSFDPEKYQEVMNFAQAANGGRPLPPVSREEAMAPPPTEMVKVN